MIVAIASGKGGTGKTTLAAALVRAWTEPCVAVDLDVEAPNLHLFLKPDIDHEETAKLLVPEVVAARCDGCGDCRDLCAYNAIALFGDFPVVYSDLCHGCGGCLAVCPRGALLPGARELGRVMRGTAGSARFLMGRLRIGEAQSPPLMRRVRADLYALLRKEPRDVVIDAPPGSSCPALEAVRDADLVVLVTEPTPFGLYDLRLAHQSFQTIGRRMAVVVNRAGLGDRGVYDFCAEANLPILAEIPFDRGVAQAYAKGLTLDQTSPEYAQRVRDLQKTVHSMALATGKGVAYA